MKIGTTRCSVGGHSSGVRHPAGVATCAMPMVEARTVKSKEMYRRDDERRT